MFDHRPGFACLAGFAMLMALGVGSTPSRAQQGFTKEVYQDFRGKKPLVEELKMVGPDHAEVTTPEDGGLRITLPKTRKSNQPTAVRLMFPIAGDFEVTASYEILSVDNPPSGNGVGIAFNLVAQNDHRKFAKLGRFQHPQLGSVYIAERWIKDEPNPNPMVRVPTETIAGKLRMIREGSRVRCLVADEPPDVFREIYAAEFTTDELEIVRLGANNNGSPAGIDVRLTDLRIRYGAAGQAQAALPVPDAGQPRRGVLVALFVIGLGTILVFGLGLVGWIYLRRRRTDPKSS